MIILTGAGGFIGSVILGYLNKQGITDVMLFDDLPEGDQFKNLIGKQYTSLHTTNEFPSSLNNVEAVIHCGANSSTLARDWDSIYKTNVQSTRWWHNACRDNKVPFIFTSSAAVYGNGQGPLNHYAFSKLTSENEMTDAVILRLFNVYGPNEYHKGRMASTPFHWFYQVQETGKLKIFENSNMYFRDFIYAEDVAKAVYYFVKNYKPGIYDLGTGSATSFETIAECVLDVMPGDKEYIPMPDDLKKQYQLHTKADTNFLIESGCPVNEFLGPKEGIARYVEYLKNHSFY
jgi:ADP-L-glycero-D-manno-heptose 6-epimerase